MALHSAGDQAAAVFAGLVETATGQVHYATAGQPIVLRLRRDGWESLARVSPPQGVDGDGWWQIIRRMASGPTLPVAGGVATITGLALCVGLTLEWGQSGFGALNPESAMRQIIPGVALLLMGTQSLLASVFFAAMRSAFDASRPLPASGRLRVGWPSSDT